MHKLDIPKATFGNESKQGSGIQRALYFREAGNKYVITHGFSKKADRTPEQEIEHAKNLMKQHLERGKS